MKFNWARVGKVFGITLICIGIVTLFVGGFYVMRMKPPSPEERYQEKAREVKACTDAGGEWFNTPGWGEACNFDSRRNKGN